MLLKKYISLGLRSTCELIPVVYSESSNVYREPQPVNSCNKPNIREFLPRTKTVNSLSSKCDQISQHQSLFGVVRQ